MIKTGDIFWQPYIFSWSCLYFHCSKRIHEEQCKVAGLAFIEKSHFRAMPLYQIKASKSFLGCSIIKMNVVSNDISFLHFCRGKYWNNGLDTLCYAPLPKTLLTAFPLISWIKIVFSSFNWEKTAFLLFGF